MTDAADAPAPIRGLRAGLWGWLAFGVILVALRGVRWDEDYEFAQVLLGELKYPASHPLVFWVHHLFTGQLYCTALLMEILPGPFTANAARNVLFVWATVLPPYLLGAALGRNALAGHVATVLMLAGITLDFDASYPQFILPGMFSNGHIGTGFALVAIAALALRRTATAFLLIGLAPAVHLGQTPPLILFLAFLMLARLRHPQRAGAWRRADLALLAGLVLGALILAAGYFAWRDAGLSPPPASPAREIHSIWAGWIAYHDMHRRPPGVLAMLLTAVFVLLAYLVMLGLGFAANREKFAWPIAVVYVGGALLIVLGVMLVQTALGPRTPEVLLSWVPYRIWNHLPPVLVAAIAALFLPHPNDRPRPASVAPLLCLCAALCFMAAQPALRAIAPADLSARYLASSAPVLFFLLGALATLRIPELDEGRGHLRRVAAAIAIALLFATALVHQFGTICAAAGAMTAFLARKIPPAPSVLQYRAQIIGALLAVSVAQLGLSEFVHRETLPRGDFERAAAHYLRERGEADALLASPMGQVLLQAQTGHPVLEDLATPFFIGYRPAVGPQINALYRDVYGMDLRFPTPGRPWQQVWTQRSAEQWRRLGEKYGFRYVVAPQGVVLGLEEAVAVEGRRLYRVDAGN